MYTNTEKVRMSPLPRNEENDWSRGDSVSNESIARPGFPPMHPSKHPSKHRTRSSICLDEQQPPCLQTHLAKENLAPVKLKRTSSLGSQSSAKTVKTSNYGHRRRVRPLPGTFPTIPADQPLSAPSPSEQNMPEEVSRKAVSKRDQLPNTTTTATTKEIPPTTAESKQESQCLGTPNLKVGMGYDEESGQSAGPEVVVASEPKTSRKPPKLGGNTYETEDFQPRGQQSRHWVDATYRGDEEDSMDPEPFHGEDADSVDSAKAGPNRKRILWYAVAVVGISICFLLGIIFFPHRSQETSVVSPSSSPPPTLAPSAQISTPTMASPTTKDITAGSDEKDPDYAMPAPPRPDLDLGQTNTAPASPPQPMEDQFTQIGETIESNAASFSLAAAGSIMSVGNQVYHLLGNQWFSMGQEFSFSPTSQMVLSESGARLAVATEEKVAVYEFDGFSRWNMLGDVLSSHNSDSVPLIDISSDGSTVCVATPNESSDTGKVQIYRFMSGRWKKLGTTIEEDLDHGYFTMDMSRDGSTIVIGSWKQEQKAQVYHLGPTNKWERIGQSLQKSNFFRRSTLASKISVALDDDGFALAFTSQSQTDILIYVEDFNEWVRVSSGLAGGDSVAMSNLSLVVGNPASGEMAVAYRLEGGDWVENPYRFPILTTDSASSVSLSGNHVCVGSVDIGGTGDSSVQVFDLVVG